MRLEEAVMKHTKSFMLESHEDTAAGIRELALDDPEFAAVAGAGGVHPDTVCCILVANQVFCGTDQQV